MCGLTGVLLYPAHRSAEEWREIADVATVNLVFNEERGREAAGVAVIQADGSCQVFKQPTPASELVEMQGYRRLLSTVGDDTVCILGHTRMPTKGSIWRNVNNHPVLTKHVVGVHNGVIFNDDSLFAQTGLPRAGEVDSEVIFRLLDTISPLEHNGRYLELVEQKVSLLDGIFATLSVDLRRPTRLLVLKHLRPLCLHYEQKWQALFFSSRYLFLRQAFGRSVITEALESGWGFYFDAAHLPRNGSQPLFSFDIATKDEAALPLVEVVE
jgi:glucosamine 6-phosphate synthetase-like amidotransferase/phosphosugar isomerase protein